MKNSIPLSILSFAVVLLPAMFPSLVSASNASVESRDLTYLNTARHGADSNQLVAQYRSYAACMNKYIADRDAFINIHLNFNTIQAKGGVHPANSMYFKSIGFDMNAMTAKAKTGVWQEIGQARSARQSLAVITSPQALNEIDKSHQWTLPTSMEQITPPATVTSASDLKGFYFPRQ